MVNLCHVGFTLVVAGCLLVLGMGPLVVAGLGDFQQACYAFDVVVRFFLPYQLELFRSCCFVAKKAAVLTKTRCRSWLQPACGVGEEFLR
ncbi:hypothetical protein FRC0485_02056 [Corynebacterium diphtheriae]|nr:hypothetical protein FRC0485_02056 [Corynebacterium diphtheriae]